MPVYRTEKGYLPSTPALATIAIGGISGLWGPLSILIGAIEAAVGYYMYSKKGHTWGPPVFVGGLIATMMGIAGTVYGAMNVTGKTTRAALSGWSLLLYPAAYGQELISKLFAPTLPTVPTTTVTTTEREYYGFRIPIYTS